MSTFSSFVEQMSAAMLEGLPGQEAQYRMAPKFRPLHTHEEIMAFGPNMGGVLLLVYPVADDPHIVLMKRTSYDGVHSGQISLPGGRFEEGVDTDIKETALREAHEEVNVKPDTVRTLGQLTQLYIPPSNFYVFPQLGWTDQLPDFVPEESEVAEIIEMPLSFLLENEAEPKSKIRVSEGYHIFTPAFEFREHRIWGATGMILSEFRELLQRFAY